MESVGISIVTISKEIMFAAIFPNVAKEHPEWIAVYSKVNKAFTSFGIGSLGKKVADINFFTYANEKGELNKDFRRHFVDQYPNLGTRKSYFSHANRLVEKEKELISKLKIVPTVPALSVLMSVDKLKPHMKEVWLAMQREGFIGRSPSAKRAELPLTPLSTLLFEILVKVDSRHEITSAKELFEKYYSEIKQEVLTSVDQELRPLTFNNLWQIAKKFGIQSLKGKTTAVTLDQLPALLRRQIKEFDDLAPMGLVGDDKLRQLAQENGWTKVNPLREETVGLYIECILVGAAHFNLPDTAGIENLLRLEEVKKREKKKVGDKKYFNRYVSRYREVEIASFREGYKRVGFDSESFKNFLNAVCTVGRFNGIFDLQKPFREAYVLNTDKRSRKLRKLVKKQRMSREWMDAEILKIKDEFDAIVAKKSFLHTKRDLELCLFLVQLVVLRYLGFRQQCIKKCMVGKNITFKSETAIAFYYDPGEIKNEVMIDQTLTEAAMEHIDQIPMLIEILQKYNSGVLDVLKKHYPQQYKIDMGDAFFGMSYTSDDGHVLVKKFLAASPGVGSRQEQRRLDSQGRRQVNKFFSSRAKKFMNFKALRDFPYNFHPHFLRAVCCDWMKKDLEMTWDEVSQAMGDTVETLIREYFTEDKRRQNAGVGFARVSRDRGALKQEKNAVPLEVVGALESSVSALTTQLSNSEERERQARDRAERAEAEAKEALMQRDFLLARLNMTLGDLPAFTGGLAVA